MDEAITTTDSKVVATVVREETRETDPRNIPDGTDRSTHRGRTTDHPRREMVEHRPMAKLAAPQKRNPTSHRTRDKVTNHDYDQGPEEDYGYDGEYGQDDSGYEDLGRNMENDRQEEIDYGDWRIDRLADETGQYTDDKAHADREPVGVPAAHFAQGNAEPRTLLEDGLPAVARCETEASVVTELRATMLLGMNTLGPLQYNILLSLEARIQQIETEDAPAAMELTGSPEDAPQRFSMRPADLEHQSMVHPTGVHIHKGTDRETAIMWESVDNHAQLFVDKGFAKVPHDKLMKIYPQGPDERRVIKKTTTELMEKGKITRTQTQVPFAFPVFIVWQGTGDNRKGHIVVDVRPLNKEALNDAYPMRRQDDIMAELAHARYITVVDAMSYYQWLLHPDPT
ncbi:hypothetical protein PWT90_03756 [Aphanocladium album]|nr:hypothetical protein PWT90_03756 [Aphanocladium album]